MAKAMKIEVIQDGTTPHIIWLGLHKASDSVFILHGDLSDKYAGIDGYGGTDGEDDHHSIWIEHPSRDKSAEIRVYGLPKSVAISASVSRYTLFAAIIARDWLAEVTGKAAVRWEDVEE